MDKNWDKNTKLEEKLFSPILKEMFEELEKNTIPSMIDFMLKYKRSYSQIHKVRNYLALKGIIEINKRGKDTITKLTPKGRKVVKAFMQFMKTLRRNDK